MSLVYLLIQLYSDTDQLSADQRATAPSSPSATGGQGVVTLIIRWNRKRCDRPDLHVIVIVNVALVALCLQIFHQDLEENTEKEEKPWNKYEFILTRYPMHYNNCYVLKKCEFLLLVSQQSWYWQAKEPRHGEAVSRHSIGTRGGSNTDGVSLHINPVIHYFHTVCSEEHLLVYLYSYLKV